ncbi:MAG TPA: AbrB/MazE/SpoVT family DNA-binding domain-containing protein [Thermoanaerobaculia bacterium]|nr:AbrB/MazE/SpoVT family DNA-binding domain-containing protein [Thermoanaerobaculia bacterium]
MTTTLDEEGRLVLPAEIRRSLGIEAGDQVVLELDDEGIHVLLSPEEAAQRAQDLVCARIPAQRDLADELIQERRRDSLLE